MAVAANSNASRSIPADSAEADRITNDAGKGAAEANRITNDAGKGAVESSLGGSDERAGEPRERNQNLPARKTEAVVFMLTMAN